MERDPFSSMTSQKISGNGKKTVEKAFSFFLLKGQRKFSGRRESSDLSNQVLRREEPEMESFSSKSKSLYIIVWYGTTVCYNDAGNL